MCIRDRHQEVYSGSLEDLIELDQQGAVKIEHPAIAIVGDVAALGKKLSWFGHKELRFELRDLYESDKLQFIAVPEAGSTSPSDEPKFVGPF